MAGLNARLMFPETSIQCCRFHLGQSWWRKIQKTGLSTEYKDNESNIGKWLKSFFGLAFLDPSDVEELYPCILCNCSKNFGQHLNIPSMKISFTCVQSTRRFEVQEKIMIWESTSFTKHISSDLDVLAVIVPEKSVTSDI
jgi:hypothetical protein